METERESEKKDYRKFKKVLTRIFCCDIINKLTMR